MGLDHVLETYSKQLLDVQIIKLEMSVKASAGNTYLELDYSGYHKNQI